MGEQENKSRFSGKESTRTLLPGNPAGGRKERCSPTSYSWLASGNKIIYLLIFREVGQRGQREDLLTG